jgi:uncharacterized membrane protein YdfJ with MMPL/SSD domain
VVVGVRWFVLAFWGLLVASVGPFAPDFIRATTLFNPPPNGTDAAISQEKFKEYFPTSSTSIQFVGYLEARNVTLLPGLREFVYDLRYTLNTFKPLVSFTSYSTIADLFKPMPALGEQAANAFVSRDGNSMLFSWEIASHDPWSHTAMDWARTTSFIWDDVVRRKFGSEPSLILAGVYSMPQVVNSALETASKDMGTMDGISLPLAAMVLMFVVGSGRLLLIPLVCLATSAAVVFGTMRIRAYSTPVQTIAPPLMMSLLIAMSIDYSLFFLTRFREELASQGFAEDYTIESPKPRFESVQPLGGQFLVDESVLPQPSHGKVIQEKDVQEAIRMTMITSGATILMSGFTLIASFCFLALSPVSIIASLGQGCALTMGVMVLVNLTLTPALLSTAPLFFARTCCGRETSALEARTAKPERCDRRAIPSGRRIWKDVARFTTSWPGNLILLITVFVGTMGVARWVIHLKVSNEFSNVAARGSIYAKVGGRITEYFGPSQLYPYKLFMRPLNNEPIFGPGFYSKSAEFLTALEQDVLQSFPAAKGSTYEFLSYRSDGRGNAMSTAWDGIEFLCYDRAPFGLTEAQRHEICAYQLQGFTNVRDYSRNATDPPTATFGLINAAVDPTGHSGAPFLKAVRQGCSKLGGIYGIECYVGGIPPLFVDEVTAVYDFFPGMIAATFAISTIFMCISFRSIVIPLRSLITNSLTLGFVYGASVLVYQHGILNWTGWGAVQEIPEGLNYTLPVIMFSMITGICSDYDIFLLVRIMEYRSNGMDTKQSVQKGLVSTGGIITAAGIIMAIAFGGLLFSAIPSVNVMGFMMVAAVLFDTFIARCIVNPAMMSLIGRYNWWPSPLSEDIPAPAGYLRLSGSKPLSGLRTVGQMKGQKNTLIGGGNLDHLYLGG